MRDTRLRIVRNARNAGMVPNWNRCLALADGTYVLIFHQDDELLPGGLSRLVGALGAAPRAAFAFGGIETIDAEGRAIGGHWSPQALPPAGVLNGRDVVCRLAGAGNFIPCQTVLLRRACVAEVGAFDASLAYTPDLAMWLHLAARWDVVHVAEPVARLRRHGGQVSARYLDTPEEIREVRRAFGACFREDRARIGAALPRCRRALRRHLRAWSLAQSRDAVRRRHVTTAGRMLWEGWAAQWVERVGRPR